MVKRSGPRGGYLGEQGGRELSAVLKAPELSMVLKGAGSCPWC